ncbi:hypothetical protein K439DRAFT_802592 [Ramaria rubella]|nr:hypothetical protein K439DRAFT_802592 [Ramaria rubella]
MWSQPAGPNSDRYLTHFFLKVDSGFDVRLRNVRLVFHRGVAEPLHQHKFTLLPFWHPTPSNPKHSTFISMLSVRLHAPRFMDSDCDAILQLHRRAIMLKALCQLRIRDGNAGCGCGCGTPEQRAHVPLDHVQRG